MKCKYNIDSFIERANRIHKNTYDYSKVEYKTKEDKVCIICPIHGEFWQRAGSHLRGVGCPQCSKIRSATSKKINGEKKFVQLLKSKSIVILEKYIDNETHIEFECIICKHKWKTSPHSIKSGHGCPCCGLKSRVQKQTKSHDDFITELKEINSNIKILGNYSRNKDKIECECLKCTHKFMSSPNHLLRGHGCPKCAIEQSKISLEEFVRRANQKHNNRYDYSKICSLSENVVEIICPIHGPFFQNYNSHLFGNGCPICKISWGEKFIFNFLQKNNIQFTSQYKLKINNHIFRIDFAIKHNDKLYFIEYNGKQHYKSIKFFGGEKTLKRQQYRDNLVKQYCMNNNIDLLEIMYSESFSNVELKIKEWLQSWNVL